ncbi:unnamed protein product [Blepharisma stoltei]|uniref:Uncharacterized protein n=1 Tax=Blepharisma stoltei TaxID=1481888 RepID=A0AAU9K1J2_9CILI|nr:unnamed protein product [Blepharisma stoltei]
MLSDHLHKQLIANCQREPTVIDSYGVHFEYHDLCARLLALQNLQELANQQSKKSPTSKVPNLVGLESINAAPTEIKSDRARHLYDVNFFKNNFLKPKKQKIMLRNSSGPIKNLSQIHLNGSSTERKSVYERVQSVYGKRKIVGANKKPANIDILALKLSRVPPMPSNLSTKVSLLKKIKSKAIITKKN